MIELGWDVKRFWVYQIRDEIQQCVKEIADWVTSKQSPSSNSTQPVEPIQTPPQVKPTDDGGFP